jgi:hypothetical protein
MKVRLPTFADPARLSEREEPGAEIVPENVGAKKLLQLVYQGRVKLTPQQLRAAIEVLPFEEPKLSTVALGHFTKEDFATLLDRAVSRSAKVIEGEVIQIEGRGQVGIEEER